MALKTRTVEPSAALTLLLHAEELNGIRLILIDDHWRSCRQVLSVGVIYLGSSSTHWPLVVDRELLLSKGI